MLIKFYIKTFTSHMWNNPNVLIVVLKTHHRTMHIHDDCISISTLRIFQKSISRKSHKRFKYKFRTVNMYLTI